MCGLQVLKPAICKYLKKVLTRKLLTKPTKERFTDANMRYTQAFIAVLSRIDKKKWIIINNQIPTIKICITFSYKFSK